MGFLSKLTGNWSLGNFFSGKNSAFEGMIGDTLNGLTGINSQMNKSYQQQIASMALQNAYNKNMWNLQNEYNSPASQLARMREAGIDVNPTSYALGTGNLSNTSALVNSEAGFSGSGSPAGNPISMLMGMASSIQGIRESKARTDNLEVQNGNLKEVTEATALDNAIKRHNLAIGKDTNMPVGQVPSVFGVHGNMNDIGRTLFSSIPGVGLLRQLYDFFQKK